MTAWLDEPNVREAIAMRLRDMAAPYSVHGWNDATEAVRNGWRDEADDFIDFLKELDQ